MLNDDVEEMEDEFLSDNENIGTFVVRDQIVPPIATSYSTHHLHTLIHQGTIDLCPSYQRDVVWPPSKQIGLIDSIFRNFYIPPIILAVKNEGGEEVKICVDGKQRLTSIQKFLDGQIPHRDTKTKRNYYFTRPKTQAGLDIPDVWKRRFAEKQITVVEYRHLTPMTEREIFQRVQLGMTLTAAEKLHAISSPLAQWIGDLQRRHVQTDESLSKVLEWDTSRGRDYQSLSQMVYCCDGLPAHLIPTASKLEKFLYRTDDPDEAFKARVSDALAEFWHIASTPSLRFGFRKIAKRVAPVEFVFIGVLLFLMYDASHEERASAIYTLRQNIRAQFVDIRNNSNVGKALWAQIENITSGGGGSTSSSSKKGLNKKRKLPDDNEDEIDEFDEVDDMIPSDDPYGPNRPTASTKDPKPRKKTLKRR